ncbi:MAG: hypothetical protein AB1757_26915 [Acidobacteriota bacterium]
MQNSNSSLKFLARKIARSKWEEVPPLKPNGIWADAICNCIRTTSNGLSVWASQETREDVSEVVLALMTAKNASLSKLNILLLEKSELDAINLEVKLSPESGDTLINDLKARHHDLIDLDMDKLCDLAKLISGQVRSEKYIYTFTAGQVKEIIHNAIRANRIAYDELNENVRKGIRQPS